MLYDVASDIGSIYVVTLRACLICFLLKVPLYEAISDDSSEEKLDASCLQGDWQPLTDEFGDFSDFGNPRIALHQKVRILRNSYQYH